VERIAPGPLSGFARELGNGGPSQWKNTLEAFWRSESPSMNLPSAEALISSMFLQPYAEYLAGQISEAPTTGTPQCCPLCGGKPQMGVLRQEGDGAKRSLICELCSTEWNFRRILCPACGEEDVDKMAVYVAEQFPHVRIEACETCRQFITTIDLTKNGNAVPVVDELAAIPLNLWAEENAYTKVRTNLLGI
jgi:FdhE protein